MILLLLINLLVFLVGLSLTIKFISLGLFKKDNRKLNKGILYFLSTFLILALFQTAEFYYYKWRIKDVVLYASREAPIGGTWLKLYRNNYFELGYLPNEKITSGKYNIHIDKLVLTAKDSTGYFDGRSETSFIIKSSGMHQINNSGINSLKIEFNELE